jgi:hypothetical protein
MKLTKDLREFIESFLSSKVEFMVVGAVALAHHGMPRFTGDLDLLVRPSEANAARILGALTQFGFGGLGLSVADFTTPDQVIQLGYPPVRVDLLTGITGVSFNEAWAGRSEGELDGLPVSMLGKAELIKNKRAVGRPQDLADVARLEDAG